MRKKIKSHIFLKQMDWEVEADQIVYQHENYRIVNQGSAYIVCDAQADVELLHYEFGIYNIQ